jgi:hypothetical protein
MGHVAFDDIPIVIVTRLHEHLRTLTNNWFTRVFPNYKVITHLPNNPLRLALIRDMHYTCS